MNRTTSLASMILLFALGEAAVAATPPTLINYQGVLRSATDTPLTGSYDMVFRFYDASTAGNEILVDSHTSGSGGQVAVSGGLFNAQLGGGTISDGAGPGSYTSLGNLFRDYGVVYLEVRVGAETLSPRARIVSAAYAENATNLNGRPDSAFLDTSSTSQVKSGSVTFTTASGTTSLASANLGIDGRGQTAGGYFGDFTQSGHAWVGYGDIGIFAIGNSGGGSFSSNSGANAYAASGTWGISASGPFTGGYFADSDSSGYAYVGYGDYGVDASGSSTGVIGYGAFTGGFFADTDSSGYSNIGVGTYKVSGSGAVSFVQNHPANRKKVIVYAAPEGDEAATYTRGTARLVDGVARVPLGETFAWVTNPDIGLTVYLTPVGGWSDLYVESRSPKEIVVRSRDPHATDVTFDYLVFGLRIGFEEMSIVQEKRQESLIPSMTDHRKRYEDDPELRSFNALERFKRMRAEIGESRPLDLSASKRLHDEIGEYDPATHGPVRDLLGFGGSDPLTPSSPAEPATAASQLGARGAGRSDSPVGTGSAPTSDGREPGAAAIPANTAQAPLDQHDYASSPGRPPEAITDRSGLTASPAIVEHHGSDGGRPTGLTVRVSERVEPGDLLVVDRGGSGAMRRAETAADTGLVGIVAENGYDGAVYEGHAPIAPAGAVVPCKVDAGYGAIRIGDLLAASATRGYAMRSLDHAPGTIVGKALEDFNSGTGVIRVLVLLR